MRYISSQIDRNIRIVALSSSLSNAKVCQFTQGSLYEKSSLSSEGHPFQFQNSFFYRCKIHFVVFALESLTYIFYISFTGFFPFVFIYFIIFYISLLFMFDVYFFVGLILLICLVHSIFLLFFIFILFSLIAFPFLNFCTCLKRFCNLLSNEDSTYGI